VKTVTKLWIGLAILIALSPLGLILPEHFKSGAAWGEWSAEELRKLIGYIPNGLEKLSSLWRAPMPDYTIKGLEKNVSCCPAAGYLISTALGIGITAAVALLIGKLLSKKAR